MTKLNIIEIEAKNRTPDLINRLLTVWESSVRATHLFLSDREIKSIKEISPEERGKGLGKRLIQYGIKIYSVERVAVNEQNPQAKGFYEHMGFQVYKRTDLDEQGNPYPLLYMRLTHKYVEDPNSGKNH